MKVWKKFLTVLLTGALVLGLSMNAFAAEEYEYTVTFYAGNQGSFNGASGVTASGGTVSASSDKIVVSGLKLGDVVGFNAQSGVSLNDSGKYYVQGIRLGGRDNDTVAASVFTVTEDTDYVVAYGIRGNVTSYTVNYQNANGTALAASQTFYGNIGDKPVVAYQYIDGYIPNALGLTKTLSANEAENVFTFVYEAAPEDVIVQETETESETESSTGTGTDNETESGTGTGTDNEIESGTGTDTDNETESGAETETTTETVEETANEIETDAETEMIVDLDDEEVPLANTRPETPGNSKMPIVVSGLVAGCGLIALIIAIVFFMKRR